MDTTNLGTELQDGRVPVLVHITSLVRGSIAKLLVDIVDNMVTRDPVESSIKANVGREKPVDQLGESEQRGLRSEDVS